MFVLKVLHRLFIATLILKSFTRKNDVNRGISDELQFFSYAVEICYSVTYNHEIVINYERLWSKATNRDPKFVSYSREFVITVIDITEFDRMSLYLCYLYINFDLNTTLIEISYHRRLLRTTCEIHRFPWLWYFFSKNRSQSYKNLISSFFRILLLS